MALTLKVLTCNIHHGEGMQEHAPEFSGCVDLARIAGVVRESGADIVALQEVDRGTRRSGNVDQPAMLGRMLGMNSCFGCNVTWSDGAEYGVATLSRFPIMSTSTTRLSGQHGLEPRGVLTSVINVPGWGKVTILNTHLQVGGAGVEDVAVEERRQQSMLIAGMVEDEQNPVVLMGDFNAEPGAFELEPLFGLADAWNAAGDGETGKTIPGHPMLEPEVRIDLIFVSADVEVSSCRVIRDGAAAFASDHLPVLAEIRPLSPAVRARSRWVGTDAE